MTTEILLTFAVLALAIFLFVSDKLRTDLVAVLIMVILPWTGVITANEAFSGFASNAVISVIGVMLIGYGVERSGIMTVVAGFITKRVGVKEKNVMATTSTTVGLISAFMQNIGAAALFLPALKRISKNANIPASKLIMPMGFAAILGGTLTMVASGPLIILNDLLTESGFDALNLFAVTPIGLALLATGILYFYFAGGLVLPKASGETQVTSASFMQETHNLTTDIHELDINARLAGQTIEQLNIWSTYGINILALREDASHVYGPWRKTHLADGQTLAVLGTIDAVNRFAADYELTVKPELEHFASLENEDESGFAEIIIPPTSPFIGKTLRDIGFRKNFRLEPLAVIGNDGTKTTLEDVPFEAGMQLVVYGRWQDLINLRNGREVAVLSDVKAPELAPQQNKKKPALFAIVVSLGLVFMGFPLSLSFFTGALLMILLGVIPKEEIYPAIDWKTVFLLAGLIPLGTAFEKSGAAAYTANAIVNLVGGWSTLAILFIIGLITMFFSLFMSNVAATVLLVPLVLMMADTFSMDPIGLALLVAVSASNSFILPTHQVNAFIMGPGGYRNADYMKAGGIMSLLFLIVSVLMVYVLFM